MKEKKTILFISRLLTGLFFGLLVTAFVSNSAKAQILFENPGEGEFGLLVVYNEAEIIEGGSITDETPITLHITDNEGTTVDVVREVNSQNFFYVTPGTYVLSEDALPGYHVTYGEGEGDNCLSNGLVTVGVGSSCTVRQVIGEVEQPFVTTTGTLRINEIVINDNGDTKTVADFPFDVVIGESSSTYDGVASTTFSDLPGGTAFSVELTVPDSYSKNLEGCSGTIIVGEENVCTITLDDQELILSNISTEVLGPTSIRLNWTSSHLATSRAVYDTVSHATTGTLPLYGYAAGTSEDSTFSLEHHVTITNLTPDTTYFFRAVSHGSPEVTSSETSATTGSAAVGGGNNFSVGPGNGGGALPVAPAPTVVASPVAPPEAVLGIKIEDPIVSPAPVAPQAVLGFKTLPVTGGADTSAMQFVAGLLMVYGSVLVVKARMSA